MPFPRPTLSELQDETLAEVATLPSGPPLFQSFMRALAVTQAGLTHGTNGYVDWASKQSNPFTSTGEFVYAWGQLKNVIPQLASIAKGTALFTGVAGSSIPAGTLVRRGDGVTYTVDVTTSVPIGGITGVALTATEAGKAGNAPQGTFLQLASSLAGINNQASAITPITGGADDEDYDAYRTRMLKAYAAPAQGGAQSDYDRWAREVPGVSRVWVRPNGAGSGSVVVYAMMDEAQSANGGFPQGTTGVAVGETRAVAATGDQQRIANYIFPLRPATALVYVAAPIAQPVNVTLANLSPNTDAIKDEIRAALRDMFKRVGSPLGATLFMSDITDAVGSVPGVVSFTLTAPTAPLTSPVGSLFVLGSLTA